VQQLHNTSVAEHKGSTLEAELLAVKEGHQNAPAPPESFDDTADTAEYLHPNRPMSIDLFALRQVMAAALPDKHMNSSAAAPDVDSKVASGSASVAKTTLRVTATPSSEDTTSKSAYNVRVSGPIAAVSPSDKDVFGESRGLFMFGLPPLPARPILKHTRQPAKLDAVTEAKDNGVGFVESVGAHGVMTLTDTEGNTVKSSISRKSVRILTTGAVLPELSMQELLGTPVNALVPEDLPDNLMKPWSQGSTLISDGPDAKRVTLVSAQQSTATKPTPTPKAAPATSDPQVAALPQPPEAVLEARWDFFRKQIGEPSLITGRIEAADQEIDTGSTNSSKDMDVSSAGLSADLLSAPPETHVHWRSPYYDRAKARKAHDALPRVNSAVGIAGVRIVDPLALIAAESDEKELRAISEESERILAVGAPARKAKPGKMAVTNGFIIKSKQEQLIEEANETQKQEEKDRVARAAEQESTVMLGPRFPVPPPPPPSDGYYNIQTFASPSAASSRASVPATPMSPFPQENSKARTYAQAYHVQNAAAIIQAQAITPQPVGFLERQRFALSVGHFSAVEAMAMATGAGTQSAPATIAVSSENAPASFSSLAAQKYAAGLASASGDELSGGTSDQDGRFRTSAQVPLRAASPGKATAGRFLLPGMPLATLANKPVPTAVNTSFLHLTSPETQARIRDADVEKYTLRSEEETAKLRRAGSPRRAPPPTPTGAAGAQGLQNQCAHNVGNAYYEPERGALHFDEIVRDALGGYAPQQSTAGSPKKGAATNTYSMFSEHGTEGASYSMLEEHDAFIHGSESSKGLLSSLLSQASVESTSSVPAGRRILAQLHSINPDALPSGYFEGRTKAEEGSDVQQANSDVILDTRAIAAGEAIFESVCNPSVTAQALANTMSPAGRNTLDAETVLPAGRRLQVPMGTAHAYTAQFVPPPPPPEEDNGASEEPNQSPQKEQTQEGPAPEGPSEVSGARTSGTTLPASLVGTASAAVTRPSEDAIFETMADTVMLQDLVSAYSDPYGHAGGGRGRGVVRDLLSQPLFKPRHTKLFTLFGGVASEEDGAVLSASTYFSPPSNLGTSAVDTYHELNRATAAALSMAPPPPPSNAPAFPAVALSADDEPLLYPARGVPLADVIGLQDAMTEDQFLRAMYPDLEADKRRTMAGDDILALTKVLPVGQTVVVGDQVFPTMYTFQHGSSGGTSNNGLSSPRGSPNGHTLPVPSSAGTRKLQRPSSPIPFTPIEHARASTVGAFKSGTGLITVARNDAIVAAAVPAFSRSAHGLFGSSSSADKFDALAAQSPFALAASAGEKFI
jgi:hypothetical protein